MSLMKGFSHEVVVQFAPNIGGGSVVFKVNYKSLVGEYLCKRYLRTYLYPQIPLT